MSIVCGHVNADEWMKYYEGGHFNYFDLTSDKGYVLLGVKEQWPYEFIWLAKVDSVGDTLWTRTYGDTAIEWKGQCIVETQDRGYVIVGRIQEKGGNILVVRTDSLGDTLWTRSYGSPSYDYATCVRNTGDGGYAVLGIWGSTGVWLLRLDSIGDTIWTKVYSMTHGGPYWLETTNDGGYVFSSDAYLGAGVWSLLLVKTDSLGTTEWARTYIDSVGGDGYNPHFQLTADGGYVMVGSALRDSTPGYVYGFLIKTDSAGNVTWRKKFVMSDWVCGATYPLCVRQTYDGGYAVIGWADHSNWFLLKVNSSGTISWTKTYEGYAEWIVQAPDSGYTVLGLVKVDRSWWSLLHTHTSPGVAEDTSLSSSLFRVFPVPMFRKFTISMTDGDCPMVQVRLYDLSGRELQKFRIRSGALSCIPESLSPGYYFLHVTVGSRHGKLKVLILR